MTEDGPRVLALGRRTARLVALGVCAVSLLGCHTNQENLASSPVPAITGDRASVLAQVRRIDPCALLGDAPRVDDGPLTVLGPTTSGCAATLPHPPGRAVTIDVALQIGPPVASPQQPWTTHRAIDGVNVTTASSLEAPNALPRDETVTASCQLAAHYPSDVQLTVSTSAPPDVDGCAIGDQVIRIAMRQYDRRPQRSPAAPGATVLSGQDPCAATDRLRATHQVVLDPADAAVTTCGFTLDGRPLILVSYGLRDPALASVGGERFVVGDHVVTGDATRGGFDIAVGPVLTVGGQSRQPVASVDGDPAQEQQLREVVAAVAGLF